MIINVLQKRDIKTYRESISWEKFYLVLQILLLIFYRKHFFVYFHLYFLFQWLLKYSNFVSMNMTIKYIHIISAPKLLYSPSSLLLLSRNTMNVFRNVPCRLYITLTEGVDLAAMKSKCCSLRQILNRIQLRNKTQ